MEVNRKNIVSVLEKYSNINPSDTLFDINSVKVMVNNADKKVHEEIDATMMNNFNVEVSSIISDSDNYSGYHVYKILDTTAEEDFKELGYTKKIKKNKIIYYKKAQKIIFMVDEKRIQLSFIKNVSIDLIDAINKEIEELAWILK